MGSSGGGGASGAVSHSAYLEAIHGDWLNTTGTDLIEKSITEVMDSALGSSPWAAAVAYDPDADIAAYEAAIVAFKAMLTGLADTTNWDALYTQAMTSIGVAPVAAVVDIVVADVLVDDITSPADTPLITDAEIIVDTAALADQIDDEITAKILPRFRRGMQDINAVTSSAFSIGEAIIEAFRDREVAKHASAARINLVNKNAEIGIANRAKNTQISIANVEKNVKVEVANLNKNLAVEDINTKIASAYSKFYIEGANEMVGMMGRRITWNEEYVKIFIEANRIKIVAKKEETDRNATIEDADAKWDLSVFQHGANLLAAIGGGTAVPYTGTNTAASTIGGALAVIGAAAQVYNSI